MFPQLCCDLHLFGESGRSNPTPSFPISLPGKESNRAASALPSTLHSSQQLFAPRVSWIFTQVTCLLQACRTSEHFYTHQSNKCFCRYMEASPDTNSGADIELPHTHTVWSFYLLTKLWWCFQFLLHAHMFISLSSVPSYTLCVCSMCLMSSVAPLHAHACSLHSDSKFFHTGAIRKWTNSIFYSLAFWDTTQKPDACHIFIHRSQKGAPSLLWSLQSFSRHRVSVHSCSLQQSWSTERGWSLILCSFTTEWLGAYISYRAMEYQGSFTVSGRVHSMW